MSDKEAVEFAKLLHKIYHQELSNQGKAADNNWGSMPSFAQDGWVKVAEYVLKREDEIWQHAEGNKP